MGNFSFRKQIFHYFLIVFAIFTIIIFVFQYEREKNYRINQLETTLDNITEIVHRYIEQNHLTESGEYYRISDITGLIPHPDTRITLVAKDGKVIYDSFVARWDTMGNHLQRPEIQLAHTHKKGSDIRKSATTNRRFYYYAKSYPLYYIRTALVYNIEVRNFLKTNLVFVFYFSFVFLAGVIILWLITKRMSDTIIQMKDFALRAGKNEQIEESITFPDNELGTIGNQIIRIYKNLKKTKDDLSNEREKLFNHLNVLNEGISFYSPQKEKTFSNRQFIQYINLISQKRNLSPGDVFYEPEFKALTQFVEEKPKSRTESGDNPPQLEYTIQKGEKYFKIQCIIFPDRSFEVLISDTTRLEKRRLMKQQLTSNIAHELKTPLASIKGYLETILRNWPLDTGKQKYFLEKTYMQAERLTELINDVSLLNNIEDAGDLFKFKPVDLQQIVQEVQENFSIRLQENNIVFENQLTKTVMVYGNESLLFSIFQNFVENSINYGGKGITISIRIYHEDEKQCYFSYSDTGAGIPEEHLPRIFERFYRVDYGRSREKGGTGLGLAIVKNAILLHKGEISAKTRPGGGIEFLFSLAKK